jgi:hypothetical protein
LGYILERIKDAQVIRLIERIGEHYRTNISNRFLRPAILQLQLDKNTWDQIEVLTEKIELFRYQGFHFDDLYHQIAAGAHFVSVARHGIIPVLKSKMNAPAVGQEKVLRDMAANNFVHNLQVFAELINELYATLVDLDKGGSRGEPPVYTQMPELVDITRQLVGI